MYEETQHALMDLAEHFTSRSSLSILYERQANDGLRVVLEKWTRSRYGDEPRYILDVRMDHSSGERKTRLLKNITADWQAIEVAREAYLEARDEIDQRVTEKVATQEEPPF